MRGALPRLEGQLRAQGQTSPPMATALAGQSRAGLVSAGHCVDGPVGAFLTEQCDGTELCWREPSPNRRRRNTWGFRFPSSHTPSIPPATQSKPGQQLLSGPTSESHCAWVIDPVCILFLLGHRHLCRGLVGMNGHEYTAERGTAQYPGRLWMGHPRP